MREIMKERAKPEMEVKSWVKAK
uniref:Uncharacterized protein n=1 Tax=Anguilla anguilla TaxID=7936 RepID=A0A0E9PT30_ANGAN